MHFKSSPSVNREDVKSNGCRASSGRVHSTPTVLEDILQHSPTAEIADLTCNNQPVLFVPESLVGGRDIVAF